MNRGPVSVVLAALESVTGRKPRRNGAGWQSRCPAHNDHRPSLTIAEGGDGRALVKCHAGCRTEAIVSALGLTLADLMRDRPEDGQVDRRCPTQKRGHLRQRWPSSRETYPTACDAVAALEAKHGPRSAAWTYRNSEGEPVGVVVRWDRTGGGKEFRPVSCTPAGWIVGGMPTPRPLYNLPTLVDAQRVYVCEGEKAADAVISLELAATTSPHGSKAASKADWSPLAGKECVILPDNDEAGRRYAEDVAQLVVRLTPSPVVRFVELPGLPDGGDAHNFVHELRDCKTAEEIRTELERLANEAEPVELPDVVPTAAPVMVRIADVKPEPIRWLWPGRIALGKLTLIAGDPGLGKSLVTLDMAARVSQGTPWPDATEAPNSAGGVVLLSAEDDLADTIRPRLDVAGADASRIVALEAVKHRDADTGTESLAPFCLTSDLPTLELAIRQVADCRLIVIDPITAYLGRIDSHKNAELRSVLAPLSELAGRHRVAVVAVTHLRKADGPAMYRAMGSLAFTAAARTVWAVTKDKDDPGRRLMLPVKNNIAGEVLGLAYEIEPSAPDGAPVIAWELEPVSLSADDALAIERGDADNRTDREQAADWLRDALANGPMRSTEVIAEAKENGIAEKTLRRAFQEMGGKPRKVSFGGGWYWQLPGEDGQAGSEDSQDAHPEAAGNFGDGGRLRGGDDTGEWGEI